jgi:UDP-glucose 4-epimerase
MKSFIVTGASGYIGSHMCYELRRSYPNCHITAVDRVKKEKLNHLYDEFHLYDLSRANFHIMNKRQYDCVFHFAALASVPEGEKYGRKYYENNLVSLIRVLDEAIFYHVKNFVFSSSCAVYGPVKPTVTRIGEEHPKNPVGVYAKTKSIAEDILLEAQKNGEINAAILRYFNAAGRNQEAELYEEHDPETHLIPLLMKSTIANIYGDNYDTPDGTAVRDYIHVVDICRAHIRAYEYLDIRKRGIVCNIGTGKGLSVKQVIDAIEEVTEKTMERVVHHRRQGDVDYLVSDVKRMNDELTFEAQYDIIDIIKSMEGSNK